MVAKTYQGLEDVLCDELISLGAKNVETGRRMVSFEGDLETMYKANLCCRTAIRILKPIVKFSASNPDELYDAVRDYDWESLISPESTFSIDSTVNSGEFTHSRFVVYRVKDGIADHFNDKYGRRPSIRVNGADIQLNVHILDNRVTISLDSSGEPLNRRGYRTEATEAPLSEVMAAGIILKTGWRGDCDFVDPMCGSGTFLIEAALIAANINPGIFRESFAFEKWPDFDAELFERLYNDDSGEREPGCRIMGGDIDPEAVMIARKNIRNARVEDIVSITCMPMADWHDMGTEGILVTNPPYGERLKPEDMGALYRSIGTTLKQQFKGWHAWILGYRDEHFAAIGLKPSLKIPLLNGSLECSLREYVLFDGTYSDFRAEGGSVRDSRAEGHHEGGPRKIRHISDEEWDREARKFKGGKGDGDRKKFHKEGRRDDRRDFRRDDRRDDRRDFRRDDRRDDRRDFRHDDRRGPSRKPGEARAINDRGPKLPESSETVFSKVHIRGRKNGKKTDTEI